MESRPPIARAVVSTSALALLVLAAAAISLAVAGSTRSLVGARVTPSTWGPGPTYVPHSPPASPGPVGTIYALDPSSGTPVTSPPSSAEEHADLLRFRAWAENGANQAFTAYYDTLAPAGQTFAYAYWPGPAGPVRDNLPPGSSYFTYESTFEGTTLRIQAISSGVYLCLMSNGGSWGCSGPAPPQDIGGLRAIASYDLQPALEAFVMGDTAGFGPAVATNGHAGGNVVVCDRLSKGKPWTICVTSQGVIDSYSMPLVKSSFVLDTVRMGTPVPYFTTLPARPSPWTGFHDLLGTTFPPPVFVGP
ncbi:MAG TPA: hypothetical protein VGS21_04335 [Acidimicrobiales bacterium]|nr:hypothetical protein [Acidimicrobiales bacterium]